MVRLQHSVISQFKPFSPWEWLTSNFSVLYHPWIKHESHENGGDDHQLQLLQEYKLYILMLRCKGLNQNLTVVDLSDFKFSFGRENKIWDGWQSEQIPNFLGIFSTYENQSQAVTLFTNGIMGSLQLKRKKNPMRIIMCTWILKSKPVFLECQSTHVCLVLQFHPKKH